MKNLRTTKDPSFLLTIIFVVVININLAFSQKSTNGTITGSGTLNYVPKFTSTLNISNSQIYDNGYIGIGNLDSNTTIRVGIGTGANAPYERLQIGKKFNIHDGGSKALYYNCYFNDYTRRIEHGNSSAILFGPYGSINIRTSKIGSANSVIDWNYAFNIDSTGAIAINTDNWYEIGDKKQEVNIKGALALFTNSIGPAILIDPDNEVKIGVPLRAKEIYVQSNVWSDFVFDHNYPLTDLDKLQKYITTNKHLPGIPDKHSIESYGINVGEMNALLLQKIEELTLYVIKLNEENKTIKAELEKIKK